MKLLTRHACCSLVVLIAVAASPEARAISIVLDYTLDSFNENWFDPANPAGQARRAAVDMAAAFLSEIIVNDDWSPVSLASESITFTDIAASQIYDLAGNLLSGTEESDGAGYSYSTGSNDVDISNRSMAGANEYVVYVGAFAFDSRTSAHAKASWDSSDRRNNAGVAGVEFNTWGGKLYFDTTSNWYVGSNPGLDPTDDYGFQDSDKSPGFEDTSDNWYWSTRSDSWRGFDLDSVDAGASGMSDLYATALHELLHALGATTSIIEDYVGVDGSGDFIGTNLLQEYGGPVPGDGGHFYENTQSIVWGTEDIVSETVLDPNSLSGVRKYLTRLDAALLRDLGYQVLEEFSTPLLAGDYNDDGIVNLADYAVWRNHLSSTVSLPNDLTPGQVTMDDYQVWRDHFGSTDVSSLSIANVPEPASSLLLIVGCLVCAAHVTHRQRSS